MSSQFQLISPPRRAPRYPDAEALGLPEGLRAENKTRPFRCACCSQMQQPGTMVWVPDSVRPDDPEWWTTEASRLNAFNGAFSGWCLPCARALKSRGRYWWRKLFA